MDLLNAYASEDEELVDAPALAEPAPQRTALPSAAQLFGTAAVVAEASRKRGAVSATCVPPLAGKQRA